MTAATGRDLCYWLGILCGFFALGCGGNRGPLPPKIRFGEEACAHCRMIISDERFAAALVTDDGQTVKFDDIGCLLEYREERSPSIQRYWTSNYLSAGWLDAQRAVFVQSDELTTPMATGIVALATNDEARRVAEPLRGKILRFDELAQAVARPEK